MRSATPKVLHELAGRPLLAYVIDAAREATGTRPLVVYSPPTAAVRERFEREVDLALQEQPRGTGDALRAALDALAAGTDDVLVLSGDVPLIPIETIRRLAERRRAEAAPMALVWAESDPRRYGRVFLDADGRVERIVEHADATAEERSVRRWNCGVYALDVAWARDAVARLRPSDATGEFYLTDLVKIARAQGHPVVGVKEPEPERLEGLDDRAQLAVAALRVRAEINQRHLVAGVTMEDPSSVYLDATVVLAEDVVIEPNVILRGRTSIGRGTRLGAGTQIVDSTVGERCHIWASVLEGAEVEDDVRVGPFAHLRPGASIGAGAELGNFAEVKKSRIGPGTRQHHFSYIGDAEVGAGVNIGAGTVTANYDGSRKHATVIGDGAFIGSDTILRAPVSIGAGAYTAAGSVVTHDVPAGKLAVGVPARLKERTRDRDQDGPSPAQDGAVDR